MKKILVTGCSSGIGKAVVELLLSQGHFVIGLARDHQKFIPTSSFYQTYSVNLAEISTLEKKCHAIVKDHPDIEVLICCAGYGKFIELEQFSVSEMQNMLHVNFLSHAILTKILLPLFKKNQTGKLIYLGSECALEGQKKGSIYSATKFALRGFVQSIRKECRTANIGVALINPGLVDTPFFNSLSFEPFQGFEYSILPEQIADVVGLLLNQKNNCVIEEINLQPMKKAIVKKKSTHST